MGRGVRWLCIFAALAVVGCSQQAAGTATPSPTRPGWTVVASLKVGRTPGPVTLGGPWAFVANMSDGTVSEIERSTGRLVATIQVADPTALRIQGCAPDSVHAYYSGSWGWRACDTPYAIAWDGSSLWALDDGNAELVRVDPVSHRTAGLIKLPGSGWSVAIHGSTAYVTGFAANHDLYAVDLTSGKVRTVTGLDTGPASVAIDPAGVWVLCSRAGTGFLDRVDLTTGQVAARYPIGWWSTAVVADGGAVFVRGTFGGDISRIDEANGSVVWTMPGPGFIGRQGIDQLGPAPDGIWLSGPTTAHLDLSTGGLSATIPVPSASVAAADGEVWLVRLDGSIAKFQLK